jgi:RNA polymerase sigma-70 factor (ECF subfamily)
MADDWVPGKDAAARGAAEQDPLAIERLVTDYHAALYRYAYRLSGCPADAEDLTQQVFLIAQQKIDQVRDAAGVQAWLFTVLRNCYLRDAGRRSPAPAADFDHDFDLEKIPQEITTEEIDRDELQQAINELPEEFKLVVLMFYFEHRSYREIAAELDIPQGTVMSRLSRAKSHLRQRLFENEYSTQPRPPLGRSVSGGRETARAPLDR